MTGQEIYQPEGADELLLAVNENPFFSIHIIQDQRFTYVNSKWCDLSGFSKEEIVGKATIDDVFKTDTARKIAPKLTRRLSGKIEKETYDLFLMFKTGRSVWVQIYGKRIIFNGRPAFLGMMVDISPRKRYEAALKEAINKAEESDRLKTTFLANISHELRTPLSAVIGFSELLESFEEEPHRMRQFAGIISKNAHQLLHLVTDLVDISLIESQQMVVRTTPVSVKTVLAEEFQILKALLLQKKKEDVSPEMIFPKGNPHVLGDAGRLKQVFNNLINNAVKFTHSGKIIIGCSTNKEQTIFFVKDAGIGIPQEAQAFVFDSFRQGDESFSKSYAGVGLGLPIAKNLVKLMGGEIWVESEPGTGATFFFTLPTAPDPSLNKNQLGKSSEQQTPQTHTVLLVDDVEHIHGYLRFKLKKKGIKTLSASNGQEALDIIEKNPNIDMVFLDIQMPVMNGVDTLKRIKSEHPQIPVVALTAYAMKGDRERYMSEGFNEYIPKPIPEQQLEDILLQFLGR